MIKPKILIVDNSDSFLKMFAKLLSRSEQYEVIPARSVEEAKGFLENDLIHLAIVDVRLENEEDDNDFSGLHFCEEMDPTVARILLTAHITDEATWQLVRNASKPTRNRHRLADGFFGKLEDMKSIREAIESVLEEEFEIIPRQRIGVLTSGGDSPGMNAAIWAIVRTAMDNDIEVMGIQNGYHGLVYDQMRKLKWSEMSDIVDQAGTILGTARYPDFTKPNIRDDAIRNITRRHISGLVVIGGDGSMKGADALTQQLEQQGKKFWTVAIPGTIDNDLWGTDMSLGAASAANAMTEEMRNMIQPAKALKRVFVCEVMGANCGFLAIQAALGIAADVVIIPEQIIEVRERAEGSLKERVNFIKTKATYDAHLAKVARFLEDVFAAKKRYGFVVVAEGIRLLTERDLGGKYVENYLTHAIKDWSHLNKPDVRLQELGYTVRGVPPIQFDVQLGASLGAQSVLCILNGETNCMVGWKEDEGIVSTPFADVVSHSKLLPREILAERPKWQAALELQQALACPPKFREELKTQRNRFVVQQYRQTSNTN